MRLSQVTLNNFRCFRNEPIEFSPYTALIGPNNAGKSTVLKAIDQFFNTTQKTSPLKLSDFNDPKNELKISLTFVDLGAVAAKEFSHYLRHDQLEFFIKAHVQNDGSIESSIHGERLGIEDFAGFHTAGKAPDKKKFYKKLQSQYGDLPDIAVSGAVELFTAALNEYESNNLKKCVLIPSEDLAFGAAGVASRLKKFINWVYIPAVKDASDEDEETKNNAFGVLVDRIIRAKVQVDEKVDEIREAVHDQIETLIEAYKIEVSNLQSELDAEFRKITSIDAHVQLDWTDLDEKTVAIQLPLVKSKLQDETFQGEISEFGHGLQRNYLMTLVHLTAKLALEDAPSIILAIEEPELYQHPPQARYLHSALEVISGNDQVLVTTHSPYFISARTFENARLVRKSITKHSRVSSWTADEHRKLIANAYGIEPIGEKATAASLESFIQPELNDAFFCGKLVLVEGPEDTAIIETVLEVQGNNDEFQRLGGLVLGVNGKANLINMIALARGFETPYFVIFDADTNCGAGKENGTKALNEKVLKLMELNNEEFSWPEKDIFEEHLIVWKTDIQGGISAEYGSWIDDVKDVCTDFGWDYDRLKKNPAVISHALSGVLKKQDIGCLKNTVEVLMNFAATNS